MLCSAALRVYAFKRLSVSRVQHVLCAFFYKSHLPPTPPHPSRHMYALRGCNAFVARGGLSPDPTPKERYWLSTATRVAGSIAALQTYWHPHVCLPSLSVLFTHYLCQTFCDNQLSSGIRYKVRTEIARKSKDAESKLAVQRNSMSVLNASNSAPQSLSPSASLAALAQADSSPNGKL